MPVIATFELDNVFALRISPRQPDGRHRRFGPRAYEAHFLHAGERAQNQFGQIGLRWRGCSETCPVAGSTDNRVEHIGLGVPKNERPPRSDVIDVLVFVGVPNVRALAPHDENRIAAYGAKCPHGRVHPAGDHAFSTLLQPPRLFRLAQSGGWHQILDTEKDVTIRLNGRNPYYSVPARANSSDIHRSAIPLQRPGSTLGSSACPSNREGMEDSLGGSGLSFLFLPRRLCLLTILNSTSYNRADDHRFQGGLSQVHPRGRD